MGDAVAHSQAELEALRGYTSVTGNLYVGTNANIPATDVTSLSALGCLEVVEGSFTILESPVLHDLAGLEQLRQVESFTLSTNAGLEALDGLTELAVLDILHIRANATLTTLTDGILGATQLFISENPELPQCRADELAASLGLLCECGGNLDSATCD